MREPDGPPTLPELALLLFLVVAVVLVVAHGISQPMDFASYDTRAF
ncbi:hypothetical protein ACFONN_17390 [Dyella humi]|uniref:Prepilin peptidase n=1 Tax=Dyella humi TaxID=1770547 RepID=A0ABW8IDC3_9GAMM